MTDKELFDRENIFGKGQANDAYAHILMAILSSIP